MSQGERYPHNELIEFAGGIMGAMAPAWSYIRVAGSLRRGEADAGDIELVVSGCHDEVMAVLDHWLAEGSIAKRLNVNGHPIGWGDKNRHAIAYDYRRQGRAVAVDFFFCTPAQRGLYFIIRTGPADFSKAMVTSRKEGGLLPSHLAVKDWRLINQNTGEILSTPHELDVFRAYNLPYIPAYDRNVKTAKKWLTHDLTQAVNEVLINNPAPKVWPKDQREIIDRIRYYGVVSGEYPQGVKWPQIDRANEGVYRPQTSGRPHGGDYLTPFNVMLFGCLARGVKRDLLSRK